MGIGRFLNERILAGRNLQLVPKSALKTLGNQISRLSARVEKVDKLLARSGLDRALPVMAVLAHPVDLRPAGDRNSIPRMSGPLFFQSSLCTAPDFRHPDFERWCQRLGERRRLHRKLWEYVFIAANLEAAGVLGAGSRGLGFGVGQEPLPAAFAACGAAIVATDQAPETAEGWRDSGQHASSRDVLNKAGICPAQTFEDLVSFEVCDMRTIPSHYRDFDFCWSSCSLEHLGSIENGLKFIRDSIDTLKLGGVAVHTTEYNVSSNEETLDNNPGLVLYRRRDLDGLAEELRAKGHHVADLCYNVLCDPLDINVDIPPFSDDFHLRLLLSGYVSTSVGIVIQKGGAGR